MKEITVNYDVDSYTSIVQKPFKEKKLVVKVRALRRRRRQRKLFLKMGESCSSFESLF